MAVIEVIDLVVTYGATRAVDGVTFRVEEGEIVALLGPNGAGKTSTVETLEGFRRPSAGRVRVLGLDPVRDHARLVPRIGVMLQRGGVYPGMTARQVLRLFAGLYPHSEDPDALIERVGLGGVARTPWRRLSGGEQQRLALALALVGRPRVAFLDEPTAGVDPGGRLAIRELVGAMRADGRCVLLTTHDLEEAERLADRLLILSEGRVLAEGSPDQLMSGSAARAVRFRARPGLDRAALGAAVAAPVEEEQPGQYRVDTPATPAAVARLTAWLAENDVTLADLHATRHTLEAVFLELTAAESRAATERQAGRATGRGRRAG
ncbi:MAG TPA: ABC transporter ATP-binding protein [Acidimicrobiales bacterium]|nr:ABC transporter ATP-binding protein [Acidimicrobiales bacterium]